MIRVRQDDARAQILDFVRRKSFYRCLRADRHKQRRQKFSVRRMQNACACARCRVRMNEFKFYCRQLSQLPFNVRYLEFVVPDCYHRIDFLIDKLIENITE